MIKIKELLQDDTKDAAGVAYFYNDRLLCCQKLNGEWGIPKGHIMVGENPLDGALREFTEETQIILNGIPKLSHKAEKKNGGHFYVFMYEGDKEYIPHLNNEHMDWGYYLYSNLPKPFDNKVVKVIDNL